MGTPCWSRIYDSELFTTEWFGLSYDSAKVGSSVSVNRFFLRTLWRPVVLIVIGKERGCLSDFFSWGGGRGRRGGGDKGGSTGWPGV